MWEKTLSFAFVGLQGGSISLLGILIYWQFDFSIISDSLRTEMFHYILNNSFTPCTHVKGSQLFSWTLKGKNELAAPVICPSLLVTVLSSLRSEQLLAMSSTASPLWIWEFRGEAGSDYKKEREELLANLLHPGLLLQVFERSYSCSFTLCSDTCGAGTTKERPDQVVVGKPKITDWHLKIGR